MLAHQKHIGLVQRRRAQQLVEDVRRHAALQLAEPGVIAIEIKRGLRRNHLVVRRQIELQALPPLRIVRPVPGALARRPRLQGRFDQAVELQPAGGQRQAQQQGTGLADQVNGIVVEVTATGLQGEEQAQRRNVGIGDQAAMAAAACKVIGLRPIGRRFAVATALQRAAARNAQVGRVTGVQQVDHAHRAILVALCRCDAIAQFTQPLAGGIAGHRKLGIAEWCGTGLWLANAAQLVQRQQYRHHMFAVFLDRTHADAIDFADSTRAIPVQPEGDAVRFRLGALHQGLDMDFTGLFMHRFDDHPLIGRILATTLQRYSAEITPGDVDQAVAGG
jgi:hypothetical protein